MNKYNLLFKVLIIYFAIQTNFAFSSMQNKIVVHVEDQIITSFEVKNKIKSLLFLSNQSLSQENINNAKQKAVQLLIDQKLKNEELKKFEVQITTDGEINNYLNNVSSKYNTDIQGLKQLLKNNNIDFELYKKEIQIEFMWQQFIFNLYKNKIKLNNNEIDEELKSIVQNKKNIDEYKLAEIEILSKDNQNNKSEVQDMKNKINEIGFENTATKFSISSSALNGGDLGWISSKSLSNKIYKIVKKMSVGDISDPLFQSNTILFIKLIDKRSLKSSDINLDDLKQKIIDSKKNELLSLFSNNHLSKIRNNALIQIKYE